MTEAEIKRMADRFLRWRIPESFSPDGGISFARASYEGVPLAMPSGTNLFDAGQAMDMARHMAAGMMGVDSEPAKASAAEFGWLIEAPGPHYLGAHQLGGWQFYWTKDHDKALRFFSQDQADATMMSVRAAMPGLFSFANLLGDAKPVEHGWVSRAA